MLSGQLPSDVSATIYSGYVSDRAEMISEILREHGFATHMICSNPWLGNDQSGFHQGFDSLWYSTYASATASVENAKQFIDENSNRDWFCFLHIIDPHVPYFPPYEFAERFTDPDYKGEYGFVFDSVDKWKIGDYVPPDDDLRHVKGLYEAEVAYVDFEMGNLFDFLHEMALDENTLIIFASDHGEEFFEHGGFEHGHTQYDELVWMPLIVKGSGFTPGERVDIPVGNTDIFPTILEYAGIPLSEKLTGVPLQRVLDGAIPSDRLIYGEGNTRGNLRKFVVQWPYKCILDFVTGKSWLYNLETDPGETLDIRADNEQLTAALCAEIFTAMRSSETAFHVWITRSYREPQARFTGTVRVPGGIERVVAFQLTEDDSYTFHDDTLNFNVTSSLEILGPNKHFVVVPAEGADSLEVTVLVDGKISPDRFFPYGSMTPEPSGKATVKITDFPMGTSLPYAIEEYPASCYIWGVIGSDRYETPAEFDEKTLEQLRSLGYIAN